MFGVRPNCQSEGDPLHSNHRSMEKSAFANSPLVICPCCMLNHSHVEVARASFQYASFSFTFLAILLNTRANSSSTAYTISQSNGLLPDGDSSSFPNLALHPTNYHPFSHPPNHTWNHTMYSPFDNTRYRTVRLPNLYEVPCSSIAPHYISSPYWLHISFYANLNRSSC